MKNLISIVAFSLLLGACGNAQKTGGDVVTSGDDRNRAIIDSVDAANAVASANAARQKSIDSMNLLNQVELEKEHAHKHVAYVTTHHNATGVSSNNTTTESNSTATPAEPEKKKMSNKTKGALIGAGTGAVLGAVTGVIVDGKKGEGAVVGGLIGAAAGAGAGTAIGNSKDKKKAASTSTVK